MENNGSLASIPTDTGDVLGKEYSVFVTVNSCSHFRSFQYHQSLDNPIMTAETSQRWSCGTLQDGVEQMDLNLREQEMMVQLQA